MRFEFARFGPVGVGEFVGGPVRIEKARCDQDAPDVVVEIDRGSAPMLLSHASRDLGPDRPAHRAAGSQVFRSWTGLVLARRQLVGLAADAGTSATLPLDPDAPSVRHLDRYLDILGGAGGVASTPTMHGHVGATLLDLIAVALVGGRRAHADVEARGVRASRLRDVLTLIETNFADPTFSVHVAARKLGLSGRYIQDLLQGIGSSFTERVMDLRLQRARVILAGDRLLTLKVSDVALTCGFNEVSYFHRCFRQRFGVPPARYRSKSLPA